MPQNRTNLSFDLIFLWLSSRLRVFRRISRSTFWQRNRMATMIFDARIGVFFFGSEEFGFRAHNLHWTAACHFLRKLIGTPSRLICHWCTSSPGGIWIKQSPQVTVSRRGRGVALWMACHQHQQQGTSQSQHVTGGWALGSQLLVGLWQGETPTSNHQVWEHHSCKKQSWDQARARQSCAQEIGCPEVASHITSEEKASSHTLMSCCHAAKPTLNWWAFPHQQHKAAQDTILLLIVGFCGSSQKEWFGHIASPDCLESNHHMPNEPTIWRKCFAGSSSISTTDSGGEEQCENAMQAHLQSHKVFARFFGDISEYKEQMPRVEWCQEQEEQSWHSNYYRPLIFCSTEECGARKKYRWQP